MRIDIESLATFERLAAEGAEHAASSLSTLTGMNTTVDVTAVSLMEPSELQAEYDARDLVGVEIGFEGLLEGETVLAMERESAAAVSEVLGHEAGSEGDGPAESVITELGNIMVSGFIDGWADYLESPISMTTPTYVESPADRGLPGSMAEKEQVLVFQSEIAHPGGEGSVHINILMDPDTVADVLEHRGTGDSASIPLDKLSVFNDMTKQGTELAAENITTMTGIETSVGATRFRFIRIEDIPAQVGDEQYVGTVFELSGLPSGYLALLFDEASARAVANAMVPGDDAAGTGTEFDDMEQSAIQELGNIACSGVIDGWANVLDTDLDHSTPKYSHDMGGAIMSPVIAQLGQTQQYGFVIDSVIQTAEDQFDCEIYALPRETELREVLEALPDDGVGELQADVDEVF